jgi:hypothetical protein
MKSIEKITKSVAEAMMVLRFQLDFNAHSKQWQLANDFEIDTDELILSYNVLNSDDLITINYKVEVDLISGLSRNCGLSEGAFWTDWR